jgi:hypothetical protein
LFAALSFIRLQAGDERALAMAGGWQDRLPRLFHNVATGPYYALQWTVTEVAGAMPDAAGARLLFFLPVALTVGLAAWLLMKRESGAVSPDGISRPLLFCLFGLLLMFAAYPLLVELNPENIGGRKSRVHLAAAVGAAFVAGSLVWAAGFRLRGARGRAALCGVMGLLAGGLVLNGLRVQDGFVETWLESRSMWTDVIEQSPDLDAGHLSRVAHDELGFRRAVFPGGWEQVRLAERLYRLPDGATPIRLVFMTKGWQDRVAASGDLFDGPWTVVVGRDALEEHRGQPIHYYVAEGGRLRRSAGPIVVPGHEFPVLPPPPPGTRPKHRPRAAHDILLLPKGAEPVVYTVR